MSERVDNIIYKKIDKDMTFEFCRNKLFIYFVCLFWGNGYITTADFKEILRELDPDIPERELVGMVNEIDVDDSGTVDFEGNTIQLW